MSKSVPIPMGIIPISVPKAKPMSTHTHASWVWVQTGMGKDRVFYTHGLPMSNTTCVRLFFRSSYFLQLVLDYGLIALCNVSHLFGHSHA